MKGVVSRDSEQSRYHVIVFTVHLRLTGTKIVMPTDKVRAERFGGMNGTHGVRPLWQRHREKEHKGERELQCN